MTIRSGHADEKQWTSSFPCISSIQWLVQRWIEADARGDTVSADALLNEFRRKYGPP
jgi:hypothetical protein